MKSILNSLLYNPNLLKKIDLAPFGVPKSDFHIYLDHLNHQELSGNKLRKLYGSILEMKEKNLTTLITIGGNYSNYLYACAFLPELLEINVVAIVKGYEPIKYGFTLQTLKNKNIPLHFHSHEKLMQNYNQIIEELKAKYPNSYFIPEGGSNEFSHLGFESLVSENFNEYDTICIGVGTRASYDSILRYKSENTHLRGYAAPKDDSLLNEIAIENSITLDYTFGGFAKMTSELKEFSAEFHALTKILLDPIYTSKMVYGIIEDYKKDILSPSQKIVAIHTGGLQGWEGFK